MRVTVQTIKNFDPSEASPGGESSASLGLGVNAEERFGGLVVNPGEVQGEPQSAGSRMSPRASSAEV